MAPNGKNGSISAPKYLKMAPNGKNGSISAQKYLKMASKSAAGSVMASEPNDTNGGHQPLDGASVI